MVKIRPAIMVPHIVNLDDVRRGMQARITTRRFALTNRLADVRAAPA